MSSLEELTKYFDGKLTFLSHALNICSGVGHEDFPALYSDVDESLDLVQEELHLLKLEINKQNQVLLKLNELKTGCDKFQSHLENALANVPCRLPSVKQKSVPLTNTENECHVTAKHAPEKNKIFDQYIHFITVDDFETVPKYMKGRLSYDKINAVITKLNEAFAEKYRILKLKKSSMSETNRKLYGIFKSQENKDTKVVHFIVDKDIEEFTSLKMDKATRNILVILRHCGVMHEIRGGDCVRYASYG